MITKISDYKQRINEANTARKLSSIELLGVCETYLENTRHVSPEEFVSRTKANNMMHDETAVAFLEIIKAILNYEK